MPLHYLPSRITEWQREGASLATLGPRYEDRPSCRVHMLASDAGQRLLSHPG